MTSRTRAVRPCHKQAPAPCPHQHKPKVPSRLSFSSLPPLPPLPVPTPPATLTRSFGDREEEKTLPTSSDSSQSRKRPRPTPRPRVARSASSATSRVSVEDALGSVGAVYIGWEAGKRDPAPLCCPVEKEKIKRRFGEAAVGWMTDASRVTPPVPAPPQSAPSRQTNATLAYSVLPALPDATSLDTPSHSFTPIPPTPASTSYGSTPSLSPPSTFDCSPSPPLLLFTELAPTASQTLALPIPPPAATSITMSTQGPHCFGTESMVAKVEDEIECDAFSEIGSCIMTNAASEHLWSSGDEFDADPNGGAFFFGGSASSSGESEASWAW
ncbi:hypothetical protein JCM3766R1_000384 [Sporobolomyces carnicolor]